MSPPRKRSATGPRKVTVHYFEPIALTLPEFPGAGEAARRDTSSLNEVVTEAEGVPVFEERAPAAAHRPAAKPAADRLLLAHRLFEQQRLKEAKQLLEEIVQAGPHDAYPHTLLGTVYLAEAKPDAALALFEAALALDARDVAARVYRGELRLAAGRIAEARVDLERARELALKSDPFRERAERLLRSAALAAPRTTSAHPPSRSSHRKSSR